MIPCFAPTRSLVWPRASSALRFLSMPAAGAGNVNVEMAVADLDAIRERRTEILDRASQTRRPERSRVRVRRSR